MTRVNTEGRVQKTTGRKKKKKNDVYLYMVQKEKKEMEKVR